VSEAAEVLYPDRADGHEVPAIVMLEMLDRRPLWWARAACHGQPVEVFFPPDMRGAAPAKAICASCEVRAECLAFAMSVVETPLQGIFGGTTEKERRLLRAAPAQGV
jgi:WhiB family transcriptional regulator, redox-sensing transcriptional regulator